MILAISSRYPDRRVAHTLSKAALQMCEGEYMELTIDPITYKLGWDEYIDIIYNKTGALFQTATQLGAIIGGGTNELLDWGAKDKVTLALKQGNEESSILTELRSLTHSYSKKAKEQLSLLPESKARGLLWELTDFSVQRDF